MSTRRRDFSTLGWFVVMLPAAACAPAVQPASAPVQVSAPVQASAPAQPRKLTAQQAKSPGVAAEPARPLVSLGVSAVPSAAAAIVAAPAGDPRAEDVAGRVADLYGSVNTWKAGFKQRYATTRQVSTGVVSFAKPDKMSWRYANGNRVVADGTQIQIFEKEHGRVWEYPTAKAQFPVALAFLMGDADLRKSCALNLLDAERLKFPSGHVLAATPLQPSDTYERALFYVEGRGSKVQRVLIIDAQGNRSRFDFKVFATNPYIPASEFVFTPPPGTIISP